MLLFWFVDINAVSIDNCCQEQPTIQIDIRCIGTLSDFFVKDKRPTFVTNGVDVEHINDGGIKVQEKNEKTEEL